MKNLLIFYAILSVSTFAGNRKIRQLENAPKENPDLHGLVPSQTEMMSPSAPAKNSVLQTLTTEITQIGDYEIQHLASISNDHNNMAFVVSASVSKNSGKMEKILIDSYDGNHFLGRKNLEIESFLRNGFTQTIDRTEIFSIQTMGFGPENGGLLELQYLEDYWKGNYVSVNFYLLRNKDDGVWALTNEDGQRINTIKATGDPKHPTGAHDMSMSAKPLSKPAKILPNDPTKNPALQALVTTQIRYDYKTSSMVLELSPEGEIHAIYFDMYGDYYGHYGKHYKKRILLKNLFEETFASPVIYRGGTDIRISPISLHPLDFNSKDGGTFAIRYKNRRFFKFFSKSKEVIMSLIKNKGEWILADEEARPINELLIQTGSTPKVVNKIVADNRTSTQRKLKIRPCKESARALLAGKTSL